MARLLSQTLIRQSQSLLQRSPFPSCSTTPSPFLALRRFSSEPEETQLVEVDLGEVGGETDVVGGMRKLEDAIHMVVVKRSAPDWLPFVPGSSYWVPPRKKPYSCSYKLVDLVGRIANPMTEEETMSLTTVRGWPSSSYFIEGLLPHPVEEAPEKSSVKSDDTEG